MYDNLISLSMYIKNEFIKKKFYESYIVVDSIEEAEDVAYRVSQGEFINILFESSSIKDRFFNIIDTNRPDISIINCNSNKDRFEDAVWQSSGPIIFNNVGECNDNDILNIIKDKKGIFVC